MTDRLSSKNHSPTVRRRRLAAALREARAKSGLSREEVADHMEWSTSKLYRLEYGRTAASWRDVRDLCELYGVPSPEKDGLIQLARDSRQRGWWSEYQDIFPSNFVALETDAATIRSYESELVPGLLQTADYARAVNRTYHPTASHDEIERRVSARLIRQGIFNREQPPELTYILSEAVIRRCVAIGNGVGSAQLQALIDAADRPHVTIRILPLEVGLHPGMEGAFVIIGFPEQQDPDVAYVEGLMGSVFIESVDGVKRYSQAWDQMSQYALSASESRDLMRTELKRR